MFTRNIIRTEELEELGLELEWNGHYLNLLLRKDGSCIDCRSYFWNIEEVTFEMMLPEIEDYINDIVGGQGE